MATRRNLVFLNEQFYHVFNRGIDKRVTYLDKRDYKRAMELLMFYQYALIPVRYSRYQVLQEELRQRNLETMKKSGKLVEVAAYCLMPNHFHLLLRQKKENGIAIYISNFVNAYTKFFNTKHDRVGSLFQGVFKAVFVETDEQLVHLTRYIHLNPVVSSFISPEKLGTYEWSSYPTYEKGIYDNIIEQNIVREVKTMVPDYKGFVVGQIDYAKELDKIKHLSF